VGGGLLGRTLPVEPPSAFLRCSSPVSSIVAPKLTTIVPKEPIVRFVSNRCIFFPPPLLVVLVSPPKPEDALPDEANLQVGWWHFFSVSALPSPARTSPGFPCPGFSRSDSLLLRPKRPHQEKALPLPRVDDPLFSLSLLSCLHSFFPRDGLTSETSDPVRKGLLGPKITRLEVPNPRCNQILSFTPPPRSLQVKRRRHPR